MLSLKRSPKQYYTGPKSDHFDGVHFFNPWNPFVQSFSNVMRWKMSSEPRPWPKQILNQYADEPPNKVGGDALRVCLVGHATLLIQTHSINILTDPIWSLRAGPFTWAGPKRVSNPGIAFDKLPKIDLVLVSHNHYDHLDINTLKKLWKRDRPCIVTPIGNDVIMHAVDPSMQVTTLDWHGATTIRKGVEVYLEPSQHWSGRTLTDRNQALWGAFVIDVCGTKIYFGGDTGYGDGHTFRNARKKFGSFSLAMLPIGAYEPRWFMSYAHMNPEEAVLACKDLGEPMSLAFHHQTFHLADEGYNDPSQVLSLALQKHQIPSHQFRVLQPGQVWQTGNP